MKDIDSSSSSITANEPRQNDSALSAMWTAVILIAVSAITLIGNIHWVRQNVVLIGHDAASYLETSIKYTRFFTGISLPQLFQAFTFPDYRTPIIYIVTQPFLHLFGIDMDGAQALNIALLPLVIVATYALGRRVGGGLIGVVAAVMVAFLPMMAAMARLYYVEMLLTLVTTVSLWSLYRCERFTNRIWSILWGICAGIGLLTKWTYPMYVLLPVLWVVWQSDLLIQQVAWLKRPRLDVKTLLVGLGIGSLLALIWFWPSRMAVVEFVLGNWLLFVWISLFSLTAYALLARSTVLNDWWASVLLAASLASLWYVPYIDFPLKLLEIDRVRAPDGASPLHLSNYTRYFHFFYTEHLGLVLFLLLIPAGLFPWIRAWIRRTTLNSDATLLWLSIISAYGVLSIILQHNARNLVPLLPAFAILLAIGLVNYGRRPATMLGGVWLAVLIVQWTLFTFQPFNSVFTASQPLWARSDYVISPSAGTTDPGYWIAPDILRTIDDMAVDPEGDPESLGILVEDWEVHRGIFRYLATRADQNLTIMALTEPESRGWSDVLANRWLMVKDGDNSDVAAPGLDAIERIRAGDALFHQLYNVVNEYPLPNGDTVTLYRRGYGPSQPLEFPVLLIETAGIADAVNHATSPQATLFFSSADTAAWVGIHDLAAKQVIVASEAEPLLPQAAETTGTLLVVTRYDTPGVRSALADLGYPVGEVGDGEFQLTILGRPSRALAELPTTDNWTEVELTGLKSYETVAAGEVLPIDMEIDGRNDGSLKMSVRLLAPDGETVAQRDVTLTSDVRLGLLVPPESEPGEYTIAGVVYDAATVEPVLDRAGEQVGSLATVDIVTH